MAAIRQRFSVTPSHGVSSCVRLWTESAWRNDVAGQVIKHRLVLALETRCSRAIIFGTCWTIGASCWTEVEEVKHKWKSLRDTYTRKKREDDCRSGQAAKNKKTWKFMKVMEFLATSTEFRSVHSNISPENMNEGVEQVVVQKEVSDREEASASTSPGSSFSSPTVTRSTFNKRKRPETPDLLDRYLLSKEARESEKEERRREKEERREQRREQQNDENYLFALGLIPALRRLSPAVQSSVKLKIHQLLHDAEFGQASSAFFPQQSPVSYHQVPPQTPTNYGCSTTSWLP